MLDELGVETRVDRLGNLIATFRGRRRPRSWSSRIWTSWASSCAGSSEDGLIRVERLGGVPERALASQAVVLCLPDGRDVAGVIANKCASRHDARGKVLVVVRTPDIRIDTGHGSRAAVEAAGIRIGTPVVYRPQVIDLAGDRIAGTAIDDRAACAVLVEIAGRLAARTGGATVHVVFTVQEEFNLRGAVVAAQALEPDVAIQLDLMLATDTPDMADRGSMRLGGGPGMSLYSFHGRGTLNGVIPHPAAVRLVEAAARDAGLPLQRSAQVGVLTDLSYVQLVGQGVVAIDVGFPMRYSHSSWRSAT